MVLTTTLNFLVPSLHPNTLIDLSFPQPKLGAVPSAPEPIVQHLPIKYGEYQPLGSVKRMTKADENQVVVADDKFQVSTLELSSINDDEASPPVVRAQHTVKARSKDVWAGLATVQSGAISALTSGLLTHHPLVHNNSSEPEPVLPSSSTHQSRSVSSPLQCLASSSLAPTSFALGGKEVDVSVWDVERTFGGVNDEVAKTWGDSGKRKKNVLEAGQIWQAKNVPQNNLSLRQPIHHLCLTYLNESPHLIVSGTKAGTVRRFDTRQRKPLSDWKVAREGGVGAVAPGVEHELFFSDRSNLLGSLDLRTGKVLYTYSAATSTASHLLAIPPQEASVDIPKAGSRRVGLASISSDSTFRLHTTTTPPPVTESTSSQNGNAPGNGKSNWGDEGKKGEVLRMVGGASVGNSIWRGYAQREIVVVAPPHTTKGEGHQGEDEDEGDGEGELGDEEVWEVMDEVADEGKDEESDDFADSDSESDVGEEDRVIVKSKPKKKAKRAI
ncbi:hypothetical protein I317_04764 [Kwoniella heveanensis CBS 569]|nr:hypothetical protein I317_04764 [Kwoniella heveanensis CBS 569]